MCLAAGGDRRMPSIRSALVRSICLLVEIFRRRHSVVPQTGISKEGSAARRGGNAHYGVETGIGRNTHQGCARHNIARRRLRFEDHRYRPGVDDAGLEPDTVIAETNGVDAGGLRRRDIRLEDTD